MIRFRSVASLLALVAVVVLTVQGIAVAQESIEVEGSADFRNPPFLAPGTYADSIVTGESVWYAVLYTNNTPYRFEVSLEGVDLDAQDELSLEARFVGPTLRVLRSGRIVEGPGASYDGGTTNVWYIEVALDTTGRLGVERKLLLSIDGVQATRIERCPDVPDCVLDEDLAELDERVAELAALIAEAESGDVQAAVEADIADLEEQVDAAASRVEAAGAAEQDAEAVTRSARSEIAEICDPEPECADPPEPPAMTPAAASFLGVLVLLGGIGFLGLTMRRKQ